jgi:hypothetical protein
VGTAIPEGFGPGLRATNRSLIKLRSSVFSSDASDPNSDSEIVSLAMLNTTCAIACCYQLLGGEGTSNKVQRLNYPLLLCNPDPAQSLYRISTGYMTAKVRVAKGA